MSDGASLRLVRVIIIALIGSVAPPLLAGDWSPSPYYQAPSSTPRPLVPEVQTDGFSCGYHALSAIYRSYGLDPKLARLRARLGTSRPAVPFVADSTGTLQPDLLRVLQQDGFLAETLRASKDDDRARLIDHLQKGQYCLALLESGHAGGLHWVVFTEYRDGEVTIGDSLKRGLHRESLSQLAAGPLLSTITLSPDVPRPGSPFYRAHVSGLAHMLLTTWQTAPLLVSVAALAVLFLAWRLLRRIIRLLRRRLRPAGARGT